MATGEPTRGPARRRQSRSTYTIEELADQAGMTVRNVRAYQSRGLLPPPTVTGRVGVYGDEHLERLRAVRALQKDGFNLVAIVSLLATGNQEAERVRRLRPRELAKVSVGPLAEISVEGQEALEGEGDGDLDGYVRDGILRQLPDGRYAAATPALLAAARRLRSHGVSYPTMAGVLERLTSSAQAGADETLAVVGELCGRRARRERHEAAQEFVVEVYRAVFTHALEGKRRSKA